MAVRNDTQYAYAAARVRAVEKKLLDKVKIDRMVDAKTPDEALKVLAEADYGYGPDDIAGASDYEALLKQEHKKVYELLKGIAPEPQIFDLFLQRNDYHNAKVLLKAEYLGQDNDEILIDAGTIPAAKLKVMIKDRNMSDIPVIMRRAIEACLDTYNRTGDPQIIDLILDKASFEQMKETAEGSKIEFVIALVKTWIDLENIKMFLRIKRMHKSWDFLKKVLLPGGSISSGLLIEKLESPLESFIEALRHTPYGTIIEEGIADYQSTGSLTGLEKLSDDYVISFIKKAKYKFLGIEPLIAYLIAKENEIKIVRIIMVGKINNIANEIIRERLREAYV
ncbi:MAG: V-type ATP synthase subunit C [Firmicutes bacterium]|nr:V-type ATP synthase subunit C [Bacillota bacterium]